jgi:hypothetical protein
LPAGTAPGVLAGSVSANVITKTTTVHRSQGGPPADLCVARYIDQPQHEH